MFYCFLADGFEEIEALATIDILRRADIPVTTVGVDGNVICGAHDICVTADMPIGEFEFDEDALGIILPGGMPGTKYLGSDARLIGLIAEMDKKEKWLAAICAAPSVLGGLGFLKERRATSYPTCLDGLPVGEYLEEKVVIDGNVITSRGVGTAIPFALALIESLFGKDKADEIAASIIYERQG